MKILDDGTVVFETPVEEAESSPTPGEEVRLPWEVQACRFYVETGNITATARRFNTTVYEVKKLMAKLWWQEEESALKQQLHIKSEAGFSRIIEKGLKALEDRIDYGERVKTKIDPKTGEEIIIRSPMRAMDIARITDMAFMKRQLLQNKPTTIPGSTEALTVLARKLQALGAKDPSMLEGPAQIRKVEPTEGSVPLGSQGSWEVDDGED